MLTVILHQALALLEDWNPWSPDRLAAGCWLVSMLTVMLHQALALLEDWNPWSPDRLAAGCWLARMLTVIVDQTLALLEDCNIGSCCPGSLAAYCCVVAGRGCIGGLELKQRIGRSLARSTLRRGRRIW